MVILILKGHYSLGSKIVVSKQDSIIEDKILSKIDSKLIKVFDIDELKIDDSKNIIQEAYIAEESQKYIIIRAKSFRVEAQNALLKLLEEPPRNINFIIVSPRKSALLPTIRSRMAIETINEDKSDKSLDLDLRKMELNDIFLFIKENSDLKKHELISLVERLLVDALCKYSINLNEKELELFENASVLANLNTKSQTLLPTLLMSIYYAKDRS